MQKFIIITFFFALSLAGCSSDKKTAGNTALDYTLPAEAYKSRMTASDPATWKPVACALTVPESGIELPEGSLFRTALERNADYLLSYASNDHILYHFRLRAGVQNPPDDCPLPRTWWDWDLRGSSAGRFMMGAGNNLRWLENDELRNRLNALIDGIEACREPDGYILAYPHIIDSLRSEEPNYARAWLTHGLIDAGIAGNSKAYKLLRGHADHFNRWDELHPRLLYWHHNSHQGHIAGTRTYLSPVGKPEDLEVAEKYYVCDWWMDELAARHDSAVWQYPLQNPHSYLLTSFEAYLDHYIATGDKTYLDAMLGAWDLIHDKWEHVGGSMAIRENQWFVENGRRVLKDWDRKHEDCDPPHSYYLARKNHTYTSETCGSAFWIKFNQRLHRLYPQEEKYVAEIEKSIYNIILAIQTKEGSIAYNARMEGHKDHPGGGANTCCEGQGTRLLGSLPEYIYSLTDDGLYVNLYEPSSIEWKVNGEKVGLKQETRFPFASGVSLKVSVSSPVKMKLHVRIPSWATEKVSIYVNDKKAITGKPGSYAELSRKWQEGDKIEFTLPMNLQITKYQGLDTVPGYDRYAVEYGPILLAAVGEGNAPHQLSVPNLENRLIPDPEYPLHFTIQGDTAHSFMPYWLVSDQVFSVYPLVK